MSKNKGRHVPHNAGHDLPDEHGYAAEAARERSHNYAMAAREKATRMKASSAPANSASLKRGNQPRGR